MKDNQRANTAISPCDIQPFLTYTAELLSDELEHFPAAFPENRINLAGSWSFWTGDSGSPPGPQEIVTLPGTMDENRKGEDCSKAVTSQHLNRSFTYTGPACYQRTVSIPPQWQGRSIQLFLERTRKTRVWVDGRTAGPQQKSYTTPHRYDLTALCPPGEHTLTIEVDNSPEGMPHAMYSTLLEGEAWSHQIAEQTQTNWNGIVGRIELTAFPPVFVASLRLRPNVPEGRVHVAAALRRNDCADELCGQAVFQADSRNGGPVHTVSPQAAGFRFPPGQQEAMLEFDYDMGPSPLLWDEFHPNLYRMTALLFYLDNGILCRTEHTEDFGMRSFTTGRNGGGRQFFINGRPTILRGEINCAVFPRTGYAPMELPAWRQVFETYRTYGLNHVRFHTWVPPKAAFQAADELGLYLYVELPQWGRRMFGDVLQGDSSDADYYKADTERIFAEYLNSPSFVMFALGNEERIGFPYYEIFLQFCKALEPELLLSDIAGHSTYPPSADFASKFIDPDYLPRVVPGNDWDYGPSVNTAPVPITGHEVGQLQVSPDYGHELPAYEGAVLQPRNLEHFRDILVQAGMSQMAGRFHRSTAALSAMLYRYFAESYLRTGGSGGFLLLGLQDFPGQGTALVGLLDTFLQSKGAVAPETFRRSCCELPVLARMERFVWTAGETFSGQILVPNYTQHGATADVEWSLCGGECVIASGRFLNCALPQGQVTNCGQMEAVLPQDLLPQALTLRLTLRTDAFAPYAPKLNDYPLWVFPARQEPQPPDQVLICRAYTLEAHRALEQGRSVLILSEGTAAALPQSRAVSFRPDFWSPMFHTDRSDGYSLGVYIDAEHPLFDGFPTEGFANWQWFEPLRGARGVLINQFPENLRPMVQPIATIDLPERLAAIFEARVGAGRLCVCTIDLLQKTDPASRQLLSALYRYTAGNRFRPDTAVEPELLRRLLPPLELTAVRLSGPGELASGAVGTLCVQLFGSKGPCVPPDDLELSCRSSDPAVLSVDGSGQIQAKSPGIAEIEVCASSGCSTVRARHIVAVAQPLAHPLPLNGATVTASSSAQGCPPEDMLRTDGGFWQSDYQNRTLRMPQWVLLELPRQTQVSGLLCSPCRSSARGVILRASVSTSLDGAHYRTVCHRSWTERSVQEDRFFPFFAHAARYIRLDIEWAVMFTGDSNAASIAEIALYGGVAIASVEEFPVKTVRFGTPLDKALIQLELPSQVRVTQTDGTDATASVIWACERYHSDIPGDYRIVGTLFHSQTANPGRLYAEQTVRVCPKDMTAPPDKTRFDLLLAQLQRLCRETQDPGIRSTLETLLTQAGSFNALTGAVQHDVDVWSDRLEDAVTRMGAKAVRHHTV